MNAKGQVCSVCLIRPPSLQCTCTEPKVLLCPKCIPTHFKELGKHDTESYDIPREHNMQCNQCTASEAVQMCTCSNVATPLCATCIGKHQAAKFYERHQLYDSTAYPHFWPGFVANFEAKQSGVSEALNQLRAIYASMDEAEANIRRHFAELTAMIATCRDEKLSELTKLREDFRQQLERASGEVREHIYEREYHSADPLANDIWNFSAQPVSFQCFDFTCDNYSVSQFLRNSVYLSLDISKRSSTPSVLPVLSLSEIRNWDTRLKTWIPPTRLSHPIEFSRTSAWVLTEEGQIAVCGGMRVHQDYLRCAYLITRNSGKVEELLPMKQTRTYHTLVYIDNTLCAFGGYNEAGPLKECEMMRFPRKQWEALPAMKQSRYFSTACVHNNSIYLSGGGGTNTTDRFDWQEKTFTTLPLNMEGCWYSASFVLNEELVTVDSYHSYRWKLSTSTLKKRLTQSTGCSWSNCPAMLANGNVYLVICQFSSIVQLKVSEADMSISEYSIS